MMIMQFSNAALWNLSSIPFEFVKGKAMENGTKAADVRERQLRLMEMSCRNVPDPCTYCSPLGLSEQYIT